MSTDVNVAQVNIEDEMKKSYLEYSMSVIVGRALPDIRDGLKPVHRRVLFGMHDLRNYYNRVALGVCDQGQVIYSQHLGHRLMVLKL